MPKRGFQHSLISKQKMRLANSGVNHPMYGKTPSDETKRKMRLAQSDINNSMYGKIHSDKTLMKMSIVKSGKNNPHYGKFHSIESRRKMSVALSGSNHPMYGKTGVNNPRYGKKHSPETRRKQRVSAISYLEFHGGFCPRLGKNEKSLLDKQEHLDGASILRQRRIQYLGYSVDGYCSKTNTVYEVYEKEHKQPRRVKRDIIRQHEIQSLLGCKFVIIWDT